MKITICGSIAFYKEMEKVTNKLENLGHEVKLPPSKTKDDKGNDMTVADYYNLRKKKANEKVNNKSWIWERKAEAIKAHFDKIDWCDAILVLNYDKKEIKNYIGANTFLEIGIAFYLNKPIFLLNDIPQIDSKEEVLGMHPIIINGDLNKINEQK